MSRNPLSVAPPMLHSDFIIAGLPPSIGDCTALTSLNLRNCQSLTGESNPLYVAPMLHTDIINLGLPPSIGDCKELASLDLRYCESVTGE